MLYEKWTLNLFVLIAMFILCMHYISHKYTPCIYNLKVLATLALYLLGSKYSKCSMAQY